MLEEATMATGTWMLCGNAQRFKLELGSVFRVHVACGNVETDVVAWMQPKVSKKTNRDVTHIAYAPIADAQGHSQGSD